MRFLRENTAVVITVGPFLDKTDGITEETGLTATNCHLVMTKDDDDGTGVNTIIDTTCTASGGNNDLVHIAHGIYSLELTAAQTNYLGRVFLQVSDSANHCSVFHEFMILPAKVFDSLVLGTDNLEADTVQWLGTACATPSVNGVPEVDVTHVAGSATGATLDSIAGQVSAIGSGTGAALNFAADDDNADGTVSGVTLAAVGTPTGTYANTAADDTSTHVIASSGNAIDWAYGFSCGSARAASKVTWKGTLSGGPGASDQFTFYAYNWSTDSWNVRLVVTNTSSAVQTFDIPLLAAHTGTSGSEAGKVVIRVYFSEGDAGTLTTNLLLVQAQVSGSLIGYANGSIWVKTSGISGTTPFVHGTADNPCPWTDAVTLSSALGMSRFTVTPGTSVTLAAALAGAVVTGRSYSLALGGQNVSGSYFEGVEGLSGTGTCATAEAIIADSHVGTTTIGEADFVRCHLMGTVTMAQESVPYRFHDCTGITNAKITFSAANQSAVVSRVSGVLTIAGMVGTNTLYIDGDCDLTLDATNTGGTVYINGAVRLTNNGSGQTIHQTSIEASVDTAAIADAVWDELKADHTDGTTFGGSAGLTEGMAQTMRDAVTPLLGIISQFSAQISGWRFDAGIFTASFDGTIPAGGKIYACPYSAVNGAALAEPFEITDSGLTVNDTGRYWEAILALCIQGGSAALTPAGTLTMECTDCHAGETSQTITITTPAVAPGESSYFFVDRSGNCYPTGGAPQEDIFGGGGGAATPLPDGDFYAEANP